MSDPEAMVAERRSAIVRAENIVLSVMSWPKRESATASRRQVREGRTRVPARALAGLPLECAVTARIKRPDASAWEQRNRRTSPDVLAFRHHARIQGPGARGRRRLAVRPAAAA
jgi:hypothetical protein